MGLTPHICYFHRKHHELNGFHLSVSISVFIVKSCQLRMIKMFFHGLSGPLDIVFFNHCKNLFMKIQCHWCYTASFEGFFPGYFSKNNQQIINACNYLVFRCDTDCGMESGGSIYTVSAIPDIRFHFF